MVLLLLIVGLLGINLLLNHYINKVVGTLLREFVQQRSGSFYEVDFDQIVYVVNDGKLYISNFEFRLNQHYVNDSTDINRAYTYEAAIPEMRFEIESYWALVAYRQLQINGIEIISPDIHLTNLHAKHRTDKISFEAGKLYQILSGYLRELQINDFLISDASFHYKSRQGASTGVFEMDEVTFEVRNFRINEQESGRTDKLFYTDDISLDIKNQIVYLKDSVHQLAFERFFVSTRKNEIRIKNLELSQRKNVSENHRHNQYNISVPDLHMSGVDFVKAYFDSNLVIDSIYVAEPVLMVNKRTNKLKGDSVRNNLMDMLLIYNEKLNVRHFELNNGHITYLDESGQTPVTYALEQISAKINDFAIDSGRNDGYGFSFGQTDLVMLNYQMNLPDNRHKVSFGEFSISSPSNLIKIKDMEVWPLATADTIAADKLFHINIPFVVLSGLDIPKTINSDTLSLDELYLENPIIRIDLKSVVKKENSKALAGLLGYTDKIRSMVGAFDMQKLSMTNASVDVSNKAHGSTQKVMASQVGFQLENVRIDQNRASDTSVLAGARLSVQMGTGDFWLASNTLHLEGFDFSSSHQKLHAAKVRFVQQDDTGEADMDINLSQVVATSLDLDKILRKKEYIIDTLQWSAAHLLFDVPNRPPEETDKNISWPSIRVGHMLGKNSGLMVKKEHLPVFGFDSLNFYLNGMRVDYKSAKQAFLPLDFDEVKFMSLKGCFLNMPENGHRLSARSLAWRHDEAVLETEKIQFRQTNNQSNWLDVDVSGIYIAGLQLQDLLKKRQFYSSHILMDGPHISARLHKGKEGNFRPLRLDTLPSLLKGKFGSIACDSLQIERGKIEIWQKTNTDSLIVEMENFDLLARAIQLDSGSVMTPQRFMFADDIAISADYLSLFDRGKSDFYNINHLSLSTQKGDISVNGLYGATATQGARPQRDKIKGTIDNLDISGLDFYQLLQKQVLNVADIQVSGAAFVLNKGLADSTTVTPAPPDVVQQSSDPQSWVVSKGSIGRLLVSDSKFDLVNENENTGSFSLPEVWLLAQGMSYDPDMTNAGGRLFYSDHILARVAHVKYVLPDKLSMLSAEELTIDSGDSSIVAQHFTLQPLVSRYDYGAARGYQSTWMNIENDKIALNKVDMNQLIGKQQLNAQSLHVYKPEITVFRDKRIPFPEWQRRPLPQTMLRQLGFPLAIDTIKMIDGYVNYQELAEKAYAPGEVFFSDLNAAVYNLNNDSIRALTHPHSTIEADAKIFGKGQVRAFFTFDLKSMENIHSYGIEVDSFDLTEFNRILIPSVSVQIKEGKSEKIIMNAKANEQYSIGEMRFYYQDLKIALLDRETETTRGLGNVLGSFFANTFIIKSDNPKNLVLRKGDVFFERDEKRAIFNYWTKSFLSGVVSSVGAANNKRKIRKMQKDKTVAEGK